MTISNQSELQHDDGKEAFATLLKFLEQDPDNQELLRDAAEAALAANETQAAIHILDRLGSLRVLYDAELNLRAIALMRSGLHELAAEGFAELLKRAPDNSSLVFNCAWALSLCQRLDDASALLTDELIGELPQAAALKVQLAHETGEFDQAFALAKTAITEFPEYGPLLAAGAVLAMDMDEVDLAREWASSAPEQPDSQTTLGMLALADNDRARAERLFSQALAVRPNSPRAVIGTGLAALASGQHTEAAKRLDQGAQMFGSHLGSWIAAAWAHLLAGDGATARARLERAMQEDANFAETHGSLAVLDMIDGKLDDAQRRAETALRLDRKSVSGGFAKALLYAAAGDDEKAQKIISLALSQPALPDGTTLGQMIARMAN